MTKISVIIPVYGVEKYLSQALDSILNQTLQDIEILLIDDGGKDACPQIIDEYAQKDSRIIAIHKANGGYGHTCNLGLSKATGEYIAILEPDDYIDAKMYEELYNIAKKYNSDVVKSCFFDNLESPQLKKISKSNWKDFIPEDKSFTIYEYPYFLHYHPSIWSCIYKKEFLDKYNIRFIEAPGAGWTDNPFQVQTMCLAERINYTSNAYYYWRRLNYFESDDLKDYTLPFKRSDEIHEWLKNNNINDKNILANLYKRELSYIEIVLSKKTLTNKKDCFNKIKSMLERMDTNIVYDNNYFTKKQIKKFKSYQNLNLARFKILFKQLRKTLIQIRLNKNFKFIILFGKIIYREECNCNV